MAEKRRKEQNQAKAFLKRYAPMAAYKRHLMMSDEEHPENLERANAVCVEVVEVIDAVQNVRYRDLLMMRYVYRWSWHRILYEMSLCGYSRSASYEMHGRALQVVDKIIKSRNENKSRTNLD